MKNKGQAATEYLIIISFSLLILGALAAYALVTYFQSVQFMQAKNAVMSLGKAADQVYALGPGNSMIVEITIPYGVEKAVVLGNEIFLRITTLSATSDVVVDTKAAVCCSNDGSTCLTEDDCIPTDEGIYSFEIKAIEVTDGENSDVNVSVRCLNCPGS